MTIAFDVSYIQKRSAGYVRAANELLQSLLELDKKNQYILHGWSNSLDVRRVRQFENERVRLSIARIPGGLKRFYWNTLRVPRLESYTGPFDVFHSTDPLLPPTKSHKTIITIHDLSYKRFPQFLERHVVQWDKYISRSTKMTAAIIVPSLQTKKDVVEYFNVDERKIHIVRFPISSLFAQQQNAESVVAVKKKFSLEFSFALFVGRFEPRKNIVGIIKAYELFRQTKYSELNLVLVGQKGWKYQEIFDAINRSPFRSNIHHLESVADSELASLYQVAKFFVYPSLYEGYGFPVLEAMASGIPVITSKSSSLEEIAGNAALLVNPENTDELAKAMQTMDNDESKRQEFSRRGIEKARKISSKSAAEQVLSLYQSLMQQ